MKITFEPSTYSYEIIVETENARIVGDIQERTFPHTTKEGKIDYSRPLRSVSTESMRMVADLLEQMIDLREEEFNSSDLIFSLTEKLSEEDREKLFKKLKDYYEEEE